MKISLIRHGRSLCEKQRSLTYEEFKNWVMQYDELGVSEELEYPKETVREIESSSIVLTSNLKRSIVSAKYLLVKENVDSSSLFREIELPLPQIKWLPIKLHSDLWLLWFRTLWFCGYSKGCESYKQAKQRAEHAAVKLVSYGGKHSSIVLVGHGFFNQLIANELRNQGFQGGTRTSTQHWAVTIYEK
ncbi:histidine phosphatase family protein [Cytobacillus spongiae]|jgi:broad specificity phosphatase PhoE|uniref:histidine phosphatase family protein n=1 Tax=Cytobacillus spongiae TaxID=2901381 RepID=UPI001F161BF2|nr:phosphoglycerate mutase family protein [Cytobacillus spongiae]UII54947.1 histidine phosphatase family protein [Cytobacillus spongiae]